MSPDTDLLTAVDRQMARGLFTYDAVSGVITWAVSRCSVKAGQVAGSLTREGYIRVPLRGKFVQAHRLAWLLHYGEWPKWTIDHINGIRDDNRLCNLRDVSSQVNSQNQRSAKRHNKLGVMGVYQTYNRFVARIGSNGKNTYLGSFATAELAHATYIAAKREMHEGFAL